MVAAHFAADAVARRPGALLVAVGILIALAFALALPPEAHAIYVYIDPGHGGPYSNANANGLREKTVNLQIALELRTQLRARGHSVGMTRTSDRAVGPGDRRTWNWNDTTQLWEYAADGTTRYSGGTPRDDLQARVDKANMAGADLFVSIHNNGAISRTARGTETYASGKDALGMGLKTLVHREVVRSTGLRDRGTGTIDFYVLRWSNMPAILVEGAFITNPSDAAFLRSTAGRRAIARGIARGIDAWLAGDPYKPVFPRMAGADRFGTAVSVSQQGWPAGADSVIVASGESYAEVLCAAPLARKLSAPILLTEGSSLPQVTADELRRLETSSVVLLGGTGAVSDAVRSQVASAAGLPLGSVRRVGGADAFETSALIAREVSVPPSAQVALVNGDNLADALTLAPAAGAAGSPILLTHAEALPAPTAAFFSENSTRVASTLVAGGPVAVSEAAVAGLPGVDRVFGPDRFGTNTEVLRRYYADRSELQPYAVRSDAYADAVVASAYAAQSGAPVMLTGGRVLSPLTRLWITNDRPRITGFTMVGGTAVQPYLTDWLLVKSDAE